MAGLLTADQIDELRKLSPEERSKKAPETIGNALAMFAMGTLERGQMPEKPAKVTPMTGEALDMPEGSAVPPKVPFNLPDAARATDPPVVSPKAESAAPKPGDKIDHPLVGATGTVNVKLRAADQGQQMPVTITSVEHGEVSERTGRPTVVVKASNGQSVSVTYGKDKFGNVKPIEEAINEAVGSLGIKNIKPSEATDSAPEPPVVPLKADPYSNLRTALRDPSTGKMIVGEKSQDHYTIYGKLSEKGKSLFGMDKPTPETREVNYDNRGWQTDDGRFISLRDLKSAGGDIEKAVASKPPVVPPKAEAPAVAPAEAQAPHTLESVSKLSPDEFFDTASQWSKDSMAGKGMGPQLMAEAAARANPDLAAWEKAHADAAAEFEKAKAAVKLDPSTMMARQKELMGLAQRAQFYGEGIKEIKKTKPAAPAAPPAEPTPLPAAPEKGIASEWTSATDDTPPAKPAEEPPPTASLVNPPTGPTELQSGISIPKFANRKMSPLDRVTASHSGKLQKSFDEARRAQREIKAEVPSERRQNAISIWREAKGDVGTLKGWAAAAKGKLFKQAAIDAQTLTPKEISVATKAGAAFDALHARGTKFDVLRSHRDAYVPHVWDVGKPGTGFGTGMLKQRFRFSKARTFDTFFDGDQAGFKPKTLAIGKLLPAYIHEMNTVIADRQAVRDIVAGTNKDGSPMAVPRGNAKVVEGDEGKAVLVQPRAMKGELDTSDYKMMSDQPALSNWTWASKDTAGRPVFIKSDLALHPDAYRRINAMIGQSALRQWYHDPVTGTAQIPRAILRGLDTAQGAMKREMFGLLAPFHQVQEGTHGVGHMVNPFSHIPKVDLRDPAQLDAANHGLMLLPDRASARVYLEGVGAKSSLLSQGIRKLGRPGEAISDVIDGYQDYLFHQYIPGLKFKTYQAILGRNMKRYAGELKSGEMTPADVKITSAEQSNAAYGHLNYALLDTNPTMQHLKQMALLAPDFLEARARFAGQAVKGLSSPVGAEQLKAIAILAAAQAGSAYILSNVTGGQYDPHHPFEVVHNGRRYAMRSVPEDIFSFLKDRRQFIYGRVNPLLVKGGVQLGTGLNYRGEKVSPLDTFTELLAGYIPITARQLPGLRSLTETSRQNPVSPLQQLAGSLGLRISRYSPVSETYKLAGKWMDSQKLDRSKGSYPISKYQQLRYALEDGDLDRAKLQYDALAKTTIPGKLRRGFRESIEHPFTGKKATDAAFAKTLSGYNLELYHQALRTRVNMLRAFDALPKGSGTASNVPSWYETSP